MSNEPCPFCRGELLEESTLYLDESDIERFSLLRDVDGTGGVEMVTCLRCMGQAPKSIWNNRGEPTWQEQLAAQASDGDVELDL